MGREMDVVTVTGEEWDDLVELREENVRLMNALRDICDWVGRWASPDHPIVTIAKRAMYPTHNVELTGLRRPYGEGPVERHVGRQNVTTE